MSEADKLFEELGYKKHTTSFSIIFSKNDYDIHGEKHIIFDIISKSFYINGEHEGFIYAIDMQEIKVINKKIEELGWEE